jgi:hypothetical protein
VLRGEFLARAVVDVFTSVYSIGMATAGFRPEDENSRREHGTGVLETEITRLYVVPAVAATLIAVQITLCGHRGSSIVVYAGPSDAAVRGAGGLLAHAALLVDSELLEVAKGVKGAPGFGGKVENAGLKAESKKINDGEKGSNSIVDDRPWMMHPEGTKPKMVRVQSA